MEKKMEPYSGFLMFHWTLGFIGVYFLIASLVAADSKHSNTKDKAKWYQYGFYAVIAIFMISGLYFYNLPPIG